MPSKLLIAAAEAAHQAGSTGQFGINVGDVKIDGKAVMKRVQDEGDRFVGFVIDSVNEIEENDKVTGFARFIDDHVLMVTNESGAKTRVEANRIVIATGSKPHIPQSLRAVEEYILTNDNIFELEDLPESVAVLGPGVIGIELGQALSRLGVRVKIFGRSGSIAGLNDLEIIHYANKTFNQEFYLDAKATINKISKGEDGVEIDFRDREGKQVVEIFSYLLVATGRRPNLDNLGLENTTISLVGATTHDCDSNARDAFLSSGH